jgi:hypothetical protein
MDLDSLKTSSFMRLHPTRAGIGGGFAYPENLVALSAYGTSRPVRLVHFVGSVLEISSAWLP